MEEVLDEQNAIVLKLVVVRTIFLASKISCWCLKNMHCNRKFKFHDGHDYSASIGTDVHSTANGRVKKSKYWGSFGNYIEVDHGDGYVTAYGHLSKRNVKLGDKVLRGQKIGEVGNTGRSTAPHLHYEVHYYGEPENPLDYFFSSVNY